MSDPERKPAVLPTGLTAEALSQYHPAVELYLLRRLRHHRGDISDLTQEVFARFFRESEKQRAEPIRNPLAYLFRIAQFVVADLVDAETKRKLVTFNSELADEVTDHTTFADVDCFSRRVGIHKDITQALDTLPKLHRQILLMVEVDGLTSAEVAQATGKAIATVRQYLSQARQMMHSQLTDYWAKEDRHL
jgi:RNA polymerase sigma factor (sigma-70 family)